MKNKIISILVFVVLAYLVPLSSKPELIFTIEATLLVAICFILLQTQPSLSIAESKDKKRTDGFSVWAILLACLLSQIFSVIEWAYFRENHPFRFDAFTSIGLLLLMGGTVFRVWCIQTLGKYFTATVQTQTNQKIITTGAYSIIRHPSYLGAYLAVVGSSVLLHAYYGIVFSAIVMFAAYYYRIRVEEETLVNEFGEEYRSYQKRTKKLFPFVY